MTRRRRRIGHVVVLAVSCLVAASIAWTLLPGTYPRTQRLSLVLGYESLAALLVTLMLGPINVLRRRPNPVSSDLRRDIGLCAAATGVLHVIVSFFHHFGGDPVQYFFTTTRPSLSALRTDEFGLSVWIGVAATIVLVGLGAISNDLALRKLGRRWKTLQRVNYGLAVAVLVHTLLFWQALDRNDGMRLAVALFASAVVVLQLAGFTVVLRRVHAPREDPAADAVSP